MRACKQNNNKIKGLYTQALTMCDGVTPGTCMPEGPAAAAAAAASGEMGPCGTP